MMQTGRGIVRVTTPRSVVARSVQPVARSQGSSLLPLLIPASLAAAAFIGKLFSRKKPENAAPIAMRVEFFAVVFRSEE